MTKVPFSPKSRFYAMRIANVTAVVLASGGAYVLIKVFEVNGWVVVPLTLIFFLGFHWALMNWLTERYFRDD